MISTSIIIILILGLLTFGIGYLIKKRWLNFIGVFLVVLGSWMAISEWLTDVKF